MNLRPPPKLEKKFAHLQIWLQELYSKSNNVLQFATVPASSTALGRVFNYSFDDTYLYICYEEHKWARIAFTDVLF